MSNVAVSNVPDRNENNNEELMKKMATYASDYYVTDMMKILMEDVLKDQPVDPCGYLIEDIKSNSRLKVLEMRGKCNRLDLRRVQTKRRLLKQLFSMFADKQTPGGGDTVPKNKLMQFLYSPLAVKKVTEAFPKHGRDLVDAIAQAQEKLDEGVSAEDFARVGLKILSSRIDS